MPIFPKFTFGIFVQPGTDEAELTDESDFSPEPYRVYVAWRITDEPWKGYDFEEFRSLFLDEDDLFDEFFAKAILEHARSKAYRIDQVRYDFTLTGEGGYTDVVDAGQIVEVIAGYIAPGCEDRIIDGIEFAIKKSLFIGRESDSMGRSLEGPIECEFIESERWLDYNQNVFEACARFQDLPEDLIERWRNEGPGLADVETLTPTAC